MDPHSHIGAGEIVTCFKTTQSFMTGMIFSLFYFALRIYKSNDIGMLVNDIFLEATLELFCKVDFQSLSYFTYIFKQTFAHLH